MFLVERGYWIEANSKEFAHIASENRIRIGYRFKDSVKRIDHLWMFLGYV
jgi:hypothetical protein